MKKGLIITLLLFTLLPWAKAQKTGVTDFWPMFFPQLKAELPEEVNETSGLFFHNGRLWTHNDSGGKPILYALDTMTFKVVQKLTLSHAKNKDWEDVCTDGERVYVGDFGSNKGNRKDLRIYTFPLSVIPAEGDATIEVDSINFTFGDQTDFTKRKVHDFDCEAFLPQMNFCICLAKVGKREQLVCTDFPKRLENMWPR